MDTYGESDKFLAKQSSDFSIFCLSIHYTKDILKGRCWNSSLPVYFRWPPYHSERGHPGTEKHILHVHLVSQPAGTFCMLGCHSWSSSFSSHSMFILFHLFSQTLYIYISSQQITHILNQKNIYIFIIISHFSNL